MISTRLTSLTPALLCSALECLGRFDRGQLGELLSARRPPRILSRVVGSEIPGTATMMQAVEFVPDERPASAELREVIAEVTADARTDRAMRTKLGVFIRSNAGRVVTVEPGTSLRFVEAGTIKKRRPLEGRACLRGHPPANLAPAPAWIAGQVQLMQQRR